MSLLDHSAHELQGLLAAGEISAVEVTEQALARIEAVESRVRAFITRVPAHEAKEAARQVDRARHQGEALPPLAGLPMAVKDNMNRVGLPTTCASKMLANYVSPYDASVVDKLLAQQAVLLGKLNMDEFAMGSSTEHSAFHPTHNPWDLRRVPGGSSGGSAAAVAAREVIYALGSDTGGSIRQPAAFCGVVGLKPSYGRVSRYGLVAFASSLDQIGPLTQDVTDAALVLNAIAGHDPKDSTSAPRAVPDFTEALIPDVRGMKFGVPKEYFGQGCDPKVRDVVMGAIELLSELGAQIEECSLPTTDYALDAYYIIAPAEASSNLARFDGVRYGYRAQADDYVTMFKRTRGEGFGPEVRRRIMLGTYALSAGYYDAYYKKAQQVRTLVCREFDQAFSRYDALLTPTVPNTAFPLGDRVEDPMSMYLCDVCTIPANLAGLPAISVPCGFHEGLPVGLQIMGKPFAEETVLRVAYAFETAAQLDRRRPPLATGGGLQDDRL